MQQLTNMCQLNILLIWLLKLVLNLFFLFLQRRQLDQQMLLLNSRPFLDLVVDMTCVRITMM